MSKRPKCFGASPSPRAPRRSCARRTRRRWQPCAECRIVRERTRAAVTRHSSTHEARPQRRPARTARQAAPDGRPVRADKRSYSSSQWAAGASGISAAPQRQLPSARNGIVATGPPSASVQARPPSTSTSAPPIASCAFHGERHSGVCSVVVATSQSPAAVERAAVLRAGDEVEVAHGDVEPQCVQQRGAAEQERHPGGLQPERDRLEGRRELRAHPISEPSASMKRSFSSSVPTVTRRAPSRPSAAPARLAGELRLVRPPRRGRRESEPPSSAASPSAACSCARAPRSGARAPCG